MPKGSVSGAAEKASTVDTRGAGSAQLVILQASMCSGSSDSDEKEHAQDDKMREEMMIPRGRELKNPRDNKVAGDMESAPTLAVQMEDRF